MNELRRFLKRRRSFSRQIPSHTGDPLIRSDAAPAVRGDMIHGTSEKARHWPERGDVCVVPEGDHTVEIGKAKVVREGGTITLTPR